MWAQKIPAHELSGSKQDTNLRLSGPTSRVILRSTLDLLLRVFLPCKTYRNFCPLQFPHFIRTNWTLCYHYWAPGGAVWKEPSNQGQTGMTAGDSDASLCFFVSLCPFCAAAGLFTLCTSMSRVLMTSFQISHYTNRSAAFIKWLIFTIKTDVFWSTGP